MVVSFDKKVSNGGILAGYSGPKGSVSRGTMDVDIDLRIYLCDNQIVEIGI